MSRVVNIGSVNIDHVFEVAHFVQPGETLATRSYSRFAGGKGFNQSVALARAGANVAHAGAIGTDGLWLREQLLAEGIDTTFLRVDAAATGQAIIQVAPTGENAILLNGAANLSITEAAGEALIAGCRDDDRILLQNEISAMPAIMQAVAARGLPLIFNPAPMTDAVKEYPLEAVSLFIVNQVEITQLVGAAEPREQLRRLRDRFPRAHVLLTLGGGGVLAANDDGILHVPAFRITPVDTTAAGDTFIGFFLASRFSGVSLLEALRRACAAAACCCLQSGAATAIPTLATVETFMRQNS